MLEVSWLKEVRSELRAESDRQLYRMLLAPESWRFLLVLIQTVVEHSLRRQWSKNYREVLERVSFDLRGVNGI